MAMNFISFFHILQLVRATEEAINSLDDLIDVDTMVGFRKDLGNAVQCTLMDHKKQKKILKNIKKIEKVVKTSEYSDCFISLVVHKLTILTLIAEKATLKNIKCHPAVPDYKNELEAIDIDIREELCVIRALTESLDKMLYSTFSVFHYGEVKRFKAHLRALMNGYASKIMRLKELRYDKEVEILAYKAMYLKNVKELRLYFAYNYIEFDHELQEKEAKIVAFIDTTLMSQISRLESELINKAIVDNENIQSTEI